MADSFISFFMVSHGLGIFSLTVGTGFTFSSVAVTLLDRQQPTL
jgi:hypothetical protein